jgi:hypothetical protein
MSVGASRENEPMPVAGPYPGADVYPGIGALPGVGAQYPPR